jgi:quercetin dioxygenase-like cupin family protein
MQGTDFPAAQILADTGATMFTTAKTILFISALALAAPLLAQPKILMQEPLGNTSGPEMSLFILNVSAGLTIPSHSHKGAVFAYVLQGDIENQLDPDPPKIFHPGDFFHERPMQVHRLLRNLSHTEPAKILVFQNTGTLPPAIKPLLQEPLANIANQEVSALLLVAPPGPAPSKAHQHPGPVFAYVVKGEIENQVDPDPPKVYRAGDVFYEPPMHAHRLLRNLSKTEPAEVVVFEVTEKGRPLAMPVAQASPAKKSQTPPRMMPYTAVLDPQFVPASEAGFLQDDDTVIGVARGSVAKAYPGADLTQHGVVLDQMPDGPIAVTW